MINLEKYEVWFLTGSQNLYGQETLKKVAEHTHQIAAALANSKNILVKIVEKQVLTDPDGILKICQDANQSPACVGLIAWMHTFSPAKMWIAGLKSLQKPLLHLHTQFNQEIPWHDIDMDFMNLNQSAHGGREFGFINSRLRLNRKVVVGHWQDPEVHARIDIWARAATAWQDMQSAKFARFGDNMREVAVTEGDKVEAQVKFGYSVNGYGMGDLVEAINHIDNQQVNHLLDEYLAKYEVVPALQKDGEKHSSLREAARIELGLKKFLQDGNFAGFTDTFENLHGLA
ncbi:MAG: L-arabinose isomerase family protein, partial [Cyclobacteriaceae bacterium]